MQTTDENVLQSAVSLYDDVDPLETSSDHDKESIKQGEGNHAFSIGTGSFTQSPLTARKMTMTKEFMSDRRGTHWPECEYIVQGQGQGFQGR